MKITTVYKDKKYQVFFNEKYIITKVTVIDNGHEEFLDKSSEEYNIATAKIKLFRGTTGKIPTK